MVEAVVLRGGPESFVLNTFMNEVLPPFEGDCGPASSPLSAANIPLLPKERDLPIVDLDEVDVRLIASLLVIPLLLLAEARDRLAA